MKVQRSNFGIKVAGYMGEAGYTSDEYQARTTELGTWYGYPQSQKSSDLRPAIRSPLFLVSHQHAHTAFVRSIIIILKDCIITAPR